MKNQKYAGYAWANFGAKTNYRLVINLFSCEKCLTADEKKEPIDDLLTVDLPADKKHFCGRCGKLLAV